MDKKFEKTFRDGLAVAGAIAVVKAAPVLALGFGIGALVSNPDKVQNLAKKVTDGFKKIQEKYEAENLEPDLGFEDDFEFDDDSDLDEEEQEVVTEEKVETTFEEEPLVEEETLVE